MTAAQICKALDLTSFQINYKCSEWVADFMYANNPIRTLNLGSLGKDTLVSQYLDGINYEYSDEYCDEISKAFPESKAQVIERVQSCIRDFESQYSDSDRKIAHICVSHGILVERFSLLHGGRCKFVNYCAISGVAMNNDKSELVFDGDSQHVKSKSG